MFGNHFLQQTGAAKPPSNLGLLNSLSFIYCLDLFHHTTERKSLWCIKVQQLALVIIQGRKMVNCFLVTDWNEVFLDIVHCSHSDLSDMYAMVTFKSHLADGEGIELPQPVPPSPASGRGQKNEVSELQVCRSSPSVIDVTLVWFYTAVLFCARKMCSFGNTTKWHMKGRQQDLPATYVRRARDVLNQTLIYIITC